MTSALPDHLAGPSLAHRPAHVRWIAGGTAAGKSTPTRLRAERHGAEVLDGDRAEHRWPDRCDPVRHPRLAALCDRPPGTLWHEGTPRQVFRAMPSPHGGTTGFLVDDLLADRPVLVDWSGILPRDLAPLLRRPEQAVSLLPTPAFRKAALTAWYADPARAGATWGDQDPRTARAGATRDDLRGQEVRRQAPPHGAALLTVDGTTPAAELAERVFTRFALPGR
ncbi:hypothetical protein ABTX81_28015 [Kitasatospora sp. NPDC097605]|uniref:hypothetical protein n=1 Tax=Kitasatospora sp. NPDC097605 TaxID=3157226 RepID=UPI0033178C5A